MFGTLRDLAIEVATVYNRSDAQSYVDLLPERSLDRPLTQVAMQEAKISICHIRSAYEREFGAKFNLGLESNIALLEGEALTKRLQIAFLQQVEDQLDTALHTLGADRLV